MKTIALEVRDAGTFIPVMAIQMMPSEVDYEAERYLLRRAGFGFDYPLVVVCRMECHGSVPSAAYDPHDWSCGSRTLPEAHRWIAEHFDELKSGDVVDVQFIIGETKSPKKSEREEVAA